jgi:PKD repeat protein
LIRLTLFVCVVSVSTSAAAATLRVCASGCQYPALQPAIDVAQPGDTILLRAGETFVGPFVLRKKAASTQWITIRSDASDTLLPPAGVRLVPAHRPGGNTPLTLLPRLLGQHGVYKTTPVLRTEPGAHHYILKFLELDGSANLGFETVLVLGTDTTAAPATDIVVDRVYVHGHRYKGMKRGITLNGARTDVLNSYISDIMMVNADSQAILGYNGSGPFRIVNNYLEAAGENIMFGGSDPAVANLVPSNIEIRRNHLFKPLTWRKPILAPPGSPHASAATAAGALASGTHYFRVVAVMFTDNVMALSLPSAVVSATVAAGKSVTVSWAAVAGADRYRIYRGTSATAQAAYLETPAAGTTFAYTGTSEKSGTPPATGTKWTVKNLLELKNAQHVLVEGNLIENVWAAGQYGYALLLTPRNSYGGAPWVRVRDVLFTNNIVRHAAGVLHLSGYDATNTSQQTQRVTLRNNLFYDIDDTRWGGYTKAYLIGEGPADVVLDRNTLIHTNSSVVYAYETQVISGFVYTNNISLHHAYGIMGDGGRPGQYTIDKYFPGSTIRHNVLAGGPASAYPTPNAFPSVAEWNASFVDLAGGDYRLLASSPFYHAGVNGSVPGADLGALNAALGGTAPPPAEPTPPPVPPPSGNTPPIARPGGPYSAATGSPITADGSASSDAEGNIAAYRWTWGDEILVNAADLTATSVVGSRWMRVQTAGASGGWALHNPDRAEAKKTAALASPASYVEVRFHAAAGVPYRLWFRMRAEADSYTNDSMFVQFTNTVDAQGNPDDRIGTTTAATVFLEEGTGAGLAGWGWNDTHYGGLGAPVYFAKSGIQTMRIQQREDGIMWDQLVLSARQYMNARPGLTRVDNTIVPQTFGTTSGVVAAHAYQAPGTYSLVLTVVDAQGAASSAATTVAVGATTQSTLVARAGGPYSATSGADVRLDASTSAVPGGATAKYLWRFGDDIVLHASSFQTFKGRWRSVNDSSAAAGVRLENPDAAEPKLATALSAPANYVEATFRAAAGVPYRLWIRMRAVNDSYSNDSVYVQFSGSVTSTGAAATRIGSTAALVVVLEEGSGAGVSGWGWADASYGGLAAPIAFNADGTQTIRIQQREDGVQIDQIVISAGDHFLRAPGSTKADATIVPVFGADATGVAVSHAYRAPGIYPVTLTLEAGSAGTATDSTTATIK